MIPNAFFRLSLERINGLRWRGPIEADERVEDGAAYVRTDGTLLLSSRDYPLIARSLANVGPDFRKIAEVFGRDDESLRNEETGQRAGWLLLLPSQVPGEVVPEQVGPEEGEGAGAPTEA